MRGIALALGGKPDEFEGERGGDTFWMLRLSGYPGLSLPDHGQQNEIGWYGYLLYTHKYIIISIN